MEKRFTVGVFIGNANSSHTLNMMQGIYDSAEKHDVNVLFFLGIHGQHYYRSYFGDEAGDAYNYHSNVIFDYTQFGKVDALVISYGTICRYLRDEDKNTFLKRFENIPYVLLEEPDETHRGTSMIIDNYNSMYEITEHLVRDHGYREFTYLSGPHGNTDAMQRKQAFLDVMDKYGISFDENRVEYGDYSACVEPQINRLLDDYPQMEAMVCANDVMADAAYRECAKRGRTVGQDIAITGYDDWELAPSMDPPLTTVRQSSYDMGYAGLLSALDLLHGVEPHSAVVPAQIRYRASCGCNGSHHSLLFSEKELSGNISDASIEKKTDQILEKILLIQSNEAVTRAARTNIRKLLDLDFSRPENKSSFLQYLSQLMLSEAGKYISLNTLQRILNDYFNEWIAHSLKTADILEEQTSAVMNLKDAVQEILSAYIIKSSSDKYAEYEQETSFLPMISRGMMDHISDEAEFFRSGILNLSALKAHSSYLYVFENPIVHNKTVPWHLPDRMYLAASQEENIVRSYAAEDRPVLTAENGIGAFHSNGQQFSMMIFCLFAGEMQYGMLVTEIDPCNSGVSHLISMQLGNALRFHELFRQQQATQRRLEQLAKEINEKNEVLNFISKYDELTKCLNRRGFMEHAVALNRDNIGSQVAILFADLDHLKEINDCFGHKEGDFAIRHCSDVLQKTIGDSGIVGRIGGDEFVALFLCPDEKRVQEIIAQVRKLNQEFNAASCKDYYVELSLGHHIFVCDAAVSISELLDSADRVLYDQKKNRRRSILKSQE